MNLAFVLFRWFPHGGLQQDLIKVVTACREHNTNITVFCMSWEGAAPEGVDVKLVPVRGFSDVSRRASFSAYITKHVSNGFDVVVGFNRLPGLDIYFAADSCFAYKVKQRGWWYKLAPRTRQYLAFEEAVFSPQASTTALLLSPQQHEQYQYCYHTPDNRLIDLPGGISKRFIPDVNASATRDNMRKKLGIAAEELLILQAGSSFRTKGLDRSLLALRAMPDALKQRIHFCILGRDDPAGWQSQAEAAGLKRVRFEGVRDDLPDYMLAADLLLHPSVLESAGMVILEAIVSGLPVLTTASCGYAFHVEKAAAGKVCAEPFQQQNLDGLLLAMLSADEADKTAWHENGLGYGKREDLFDMPKTVADLIMTIGKANRRRKGGHNGAD